MNQKENYNGLKKTLKFIANVVSWTILVFLLLIAAFLAYYFITNKIYAMKGQKYEPAVGLYTIVSPSMTPNLNVYDVIVDVKVKKPEDIKVGDIITFISTSSISKGLTITHRVVAIVETENGLEYKTQGDNNLTPDSTTVQFQNVLGKVLIKIPQLGRIQYFLSSSSGWLIIVVIPAALIILSDIVKIIRLSKTKKKVNKALETEERKQEQMEEEKEQIKNKLKERYAETLNEQNAYEEKQEEYNIEMPETEERKQEQMEEEKELITNNPKEHYAETLNEQNAYEEKQEEYNVEMPEIKENSDIEETLDEADLNKDFTSNESHTTEIKFDLPKLRDNDKKD